MRPKFPKLILALGLTLLALIPTLVAVAQESTENDFIFNFSGYSSARNWACHSGYKGQNVLLKIGV